MRGSKSKDRTTNPVLEENVYRNHAGTSARIQGWGLGLDG